LIISCSQAEFQASLNQAEIIITLLTQNSPNHCKLFSTKDSGIAIIAMSGTSGRCEISTNISISLFQDLMLFPSKEGFTQYFFPSKTSKLLTRSFHTLPGVALAQITTAELISKNWCFIVFIINYDFLYT
jgi:hypothetical protein